MSLNDLSIKTKFLRIKKKIKEIKQNRTYGKKCNINMH